MRKNLVSLFLFFTVFGLIATFQNCARLPFFSGSEEPSPLAQRGNGDSYDGKPTYFLPVEPGNPCNRLAASGKPFPSRQIFFMNGTYSLVRNQCRDIDPIPLMASEFSYNSSTDTLTYQGQAFRVQADLSEFNQAPIVCSGGRQPVGPNIFETPMDLSGPEWRIMHPEIPAVLAGSLSALPLFSIAVVDGSLLEDWRRVSQQVMLTPGSNYVVSFLLKSGSVNTASILYYESNNSTFRVGVDMGAGSANVFDTIGVPVSVVSQPYGNGQAVSVSFTAGGNGADIGVAPWRPAGNGFYSVGDSIFATAAALHRCN